MSSLGEGDFEAAVLEGSSKRSPWNAFKKIKGNKSIKMQSQLMDVQDQTLPGPQYDLLKRRSVFLNAVEASEVALAAELIDSFRFMKSAAFGAQDASGNGPLQIAALQNNSQMTRMLLDKGISPNDVDNNHGTALQAAIYVDSIAVINVLLDPERLPRADVNAVGGYYGCALQVAAFKGSAALIHRLLELGADVSIRGGRYGFVLEAAARSGLPSILELILRAKPRSRNIDVNEEGGIYGTALQAAAKGDSTGSTRYLRHLSRGRVLRQAISTPRTTSTEKPDYLGVAKMLFKEGAVVKYGNGRLRSPINAAAASGNVDMLELLVSQDTNIVSKEPKLRYQCKDAYSYALISAITQSFSRNSLTLVRLLVENGADVNFEAGSGAYATPLIAAAAMNSVPVAEYLLEVAEHKLATVNAESGIYGSALRAALSANARDTANYLIARGADTSTTGDSWFGNILHLAVFSNMTEIVELLLQKGLVNVNLGDEAGQTALHIAAYRGYESMVSLLLQHGAEPGRLDAWGDTPLKIVEDVIGRESDYGPTLKDLRKIKQHLLEAPGGRGEHTPDLVQGPSTGKARLVNQPRQSTARPVWLSPLWNPGLGFNATIVDFLEKEGVEYLLIKRMSIDDLLYRKHAVAELMREGLGYKRKMRWYHIPSNNMTWAEMLMQKLRAEKRSIPYKSFWGTEPYFVSPDLTPHARFVTPQCERLVPDTIAGPNQLPQWPESPPEGGEANQNTLFIAMPYLHWESYRGVKAVSDLLDEIKEDAVKTRILRRNKTWRPHGHDRHLGHPDLPEAKDRAFKFPNMTMNEIFPSDDNELLKKYLFKRWPIHLRRTLHQYYYTYLTDTRTRDADQVVLRVRNERLHENMVKMGASYHGGMPSALTGKKQSRYTSDNWKTADKDAKKDKEIFPATQKDKQPVMDENSPIIMVDQLWLWILGPDTIVTSFPRRWLDRDDGDLDTENKTDVLETLLCYLRSAKRHPIQDAYDLSELITAQCVGILHNTDVISDLDFFRIFGIETDRRVYDVASRLIAFPLESKEFMDFLKSSPRISKNYMMPFEKIFSVERETILLRQLQVLIDELEMLIGLCNDQVFVLKNAGKAIGEDRMRMLRTRTSAFIFEHQSEKHIRLLQRMQVQVSQASENLKDLLALKSQQVTIQEARINWNQSVVSKRQGKTIMVFTIVTIVFLPLTFMTTVFTLPVLDFERWDPVDITMSKPDGMLKGRYAFTMIASVTLAMAIPLIIAAFQVRRIERLWEKVRGSE